MTAVVAVVFAVKDFYRIPEYANLLAISQTYLVLACVNRALIRLPPNAEQDL